MKHARCKAAVTVILLLAFGASHAARSEGMPPGPPAAAEAARARGGLEPAACRDVTPHKVRFVNVEPGVRLEVIDFGGARHPRPVHGVAVRLRRRCSRPHRARHGAGAQLRRARLLGQPQHRIPVAGHRRLPALRARDDVVLPAARARAGVSRADPRLAVADRQPGHRRGRRLSAARPAPRPRRAAGSRARAA